MADPQQSEATRDTRNGNENQGRSAYWCYHCNKEVMVETSADGENSETLCPECERGFVESMSTAQIWPDARRRRIRGRRTGSSGQDRFVETISLTEALEGTDPQQVMQMLDFLGLSAVHNHQPARSHSGDADQGQRASRGDERMTANGSRNDISSEFSSISRLNMLEDQQETLAGGNNGRFPDASASHHNSRPEGTLYEEQGRHSDTEGLQLQVVWDSDEDQDEAWEQAEIADVDTETAVAESSTGALVSEENGELELVPQERSRELGRQQSSRTQQGMGIGQNLQQYLQEILHSLVGNDVEVRVELPEGPLYIGNPGDYLDARGFEQLLLQLAENDNSWRGAPPAAKSVVDSLPFVTVEQKHIDDGSALCTVCKEFIAVGEEAKQLPCFHLYHDDCILPWLNCRNSCPICRYELLTDDPDYEAQKEQNREVHFNESMDSSSIQSQAGNRNNNFQGQPESGVLQHRGENSDLLSDVDRGETGTQRRFSGISVGGEENQGAAEELGLVEELQSSYGTPSNEDNRVHSNHPNQRTGRGWFFFAAGPVLSVVGLVLVLCIGNHFMGGRLDQQVREMQSEHSGLFSESNIDQLGISSESSSQGQWWLPFHGQEL